MRVVKSRRKSLDGAHGCEWASGISASEGVKTGKVLMELRSADGSDGGGSSLQQQKSVCRATGWRIYELRSSRRACGQPPVGPGAQR